MFYGQGLHGCTKRLSIWWENDVDNYEGKLFEPFTSDLGLNQLITEPTHFVGESKSCIDLIFTDQPNLFLESGVHPTLHDQCHHQIIYGMLSIKNPAPPPYQRRLWYYDKANTTAIRKSIEMYNWREALENITCPSHQVEILNEVLLNIFSNFMINRTSKTIEDAKHKYFMKIGETLSNSDVGNKRYWSLINKILNKTKVPLMSRSIRTLTIPPPGIPGVNEIFVCKCPGAGKNFLANARGPGKN